MACLWRCICFNIKFSSPWSYVMQLAGYFCLVILLLVIAYWFRWFSSIIHLLGSFFLLLLSGMKTSLEVKRKGGQKEKLKYFRNLNILMMKMIWNLTSRSLSLSLSLYIYIYLFILKTTFLSFFFQMYVDERDCICPWKATGKNSVQDRADGES